MPSSLVVPLLLALAGSGWSGDPSEPSTTRLRQVQGEVLGPNGNPLAHTRVLVASSTIEDQPGEVVGQVQTDAAGQFTFKLTQPHLALDRCSIWVVSDGLLVSASMIVGSPLRLILHESHGATFQVAGPDGRPVAGAKVTPRRLARKPGLIPAALADQTSARTDPLGFVSLAHYRPEEILSVEVEAAGFGVQIRHFREADGLASPGLKSIVLDAPGKVVGLVKTEEGDPVAGVGVILTSASTRGATNDGLATVRTDTQGRFEVPCLASGVVTAKVQPLPGNPYLPARVARRNLEPGKTIEVELLLRRGIKAVGEVRDAQSHQPVPDVMVWVLSAGSGDPAVVKSDANGRYEAFIPVGLVSHRVLSTPHPYLTPPPFIGPRLVEAPAGIAQFALPPIELQTGGELVGQVLDASGKPVDGASVEVSWTQADGRNRALMTRRSSAGADGRFVVSPVPLGCELEVTAKGHETETPGLQRVRVEAKKEPNEPIVLRLPSTRGLLTGGRVRTADGHSVSGASVRVWALERTPSGAIADLRLVRFGRTDELRTDGEGVFSFPQPLRTGCEYRVVASAEDLAAARTGWLSSGRVDSSGFPDLVLERTQSKQVVQGRVLDDQGRGVEGVALRTSQDGLCCRRATSDAQGRFQLEGLSSANVIVFAEKANYRFAGRVVSVATGQVEIRLARLDQPTAPLRSRAVPLASLSQVRRVLSPYAERVATDGDQASRLKTLELLAQVDPARVLRLVDDKVIHDRWLVDHLLETVAESQNAEGVADRVEVLGSINDAERRVFTALAIARTLSRDAKSGRRFWIEKALADSRKVADRSRQVVCLARVAEHLAEIGQVEVGARLMRETLPMAEALAVGSSGARARAEFAETLAQFDPLTALELSEPLIDPGAFDRCRLAIACSLATREPASVARVLATLRDPRSMSQALPRLCRALAPVDPEQARFLMGRIRGDDPCLAPYSLGFMALGVAEKNPGQATAWLREAFDRLGKIAAAGPVGSPTQRDPSAVAAALLPVAEAVDPSLVPELLWKAVSFHTPSSDPQSQADAVFALLIARYDLNVAQLYLEPLTRRASLSEEPDLAPLMTALGVVDPARAVALLESLPEPSDLTFHRPKNKARLTLAQTLSRGASPCWRDATSQFLRLAPPE